MRERIIRITKILISMLLMYLLIRQIDYIEFKSVLGHTSFDGVLIVVIAYLLSVILNAIKWKVLLPRTELKFLVGLSFRAQLYSTVLPGQLFGEVSKITAWADRDEDTTRVATSVVFDKITGMIGQIIIGVCGVYFSKHATGITNKWIIVVLPIIGLGLLTLSANTNVAVGIHKIIKGLGTVSEKLGSKLTELYDSWILFSSDILIMIKSIGWGIINQLVGIVSVWYLVMRMGMSVDLIDLCWVIPLMSIILLLPISFAGIGLRDASLASMLGILGVSNGSALVVSLSLLLAQLIGAGIGGIYVLKNNLIKKG